MSKSSISFNVLSWIYLSKRIIIIVIWSHKSMKSYIFGGKRHFYAFKETKWTMLSLWFQRWVTVKSSFQLYNSKTFLFLPIFLTYKVQLNTKNIFFTVENRIHENRQDFIFKTNFSFFLRNDFFMQAMTMSLNLWM